MRYEYYRKDEKIFVALSVSPIKQDEFKRGIRVYENINYKIIE